MWVGLSDAVCITRLALGAKEAEEEMPAFSICSESALSKAKAFTGGRQLESVSRVSYRGLPALHEGSSQVGHPQLLPQLQEQLSWAAFCLLASKAGSFLPFLLCELLFSCSPWTSASQASLSFTMS